MIKVANLLMKRGRKRIPGKKVYSVKGLGQKEKPKANVEIAGKERVIKY